MRPMFEFNRQSNSAGRLGQLARVFTASGLLLAGVGCARPYYYQPPMGGGGYPIQTLTPGQPYAPGGTYGAPPTYGAPTAPTYGQPTYGQPTLGAPGSLQPVPSQPPPPPPTYNNNTPNYQPPTQDNSGSNDPYFPSQPSDNPVPDYADPAFDQPSGGGFGNPNDDFLPPNTLDSDLNEAFNSTLTPAPKSVDLAAVPTDTPMHDSSLLPADGFASMGGIDPVGFETASSTPAGGAEPYAFDPDGYSWLRGIVSYDQADQSWTITYDVTPDTWDTYAGHLTLEGTMPADVKDNDIVLVEGAVDPAHTDRLGKPIYRIATISPLEPIAP